MLQKRCYQNAMEVSRHENSSVGITTNYPEITACRGLCPCNTYEGKHAVDEGLNIRAVAC